MKHLSINNLIEYLIIQSRIDYDEKEIKKNIKYILIKIQQ